MTTFRFSAVLCAALFPVSLAADTISITDAYVRAASPAARSGAAFMVLENTGGTDDRLVSASAPIAARVELHTHLDDGNGVMQMREVEGGFAVPAGGRHVLARGGDHVMFMGLTQGLTDGMRVPLTLVFENAGEITVQVPVDNARKPMAHGAHGGQGN